MMWVIPFCKVHLLFFVCLVVEKEKRNHWIIPLIYCYILYGFTMLIVKDAQRCQPNSVFPISCIWRGKWLEDKNIDLHFFFFFCSCCFHILVCHAMKAQKLIEQWSRRMPNLFLKLGRGDWELMRILSYASFLKKAGLIWLLLVLLTTIHILHHC